MVRLRWLGHAMFLITSPGGIRVVTDPFGGGMGYGTPQVTADVVTVSHEHFDHNAVKEVRGDPLVLRGLNARGGWQRISREVGDVRLTSVPGTYHDADEGARRGRNALWLVETGEMKLLHLGDLGHVPSRTVAGNVGRPDVLFLPVGGVYTADAADADQVAGLFNPRVVVPMHYRTPAIADWPIATVDEFLAGKPEVRHFQQGELELTPDGLPQGCSVWVLTVTGAEG